MSAFQSKGKDMMRGKDLYTPQSDDSDFEGIPFQPNKSSGHGYKSRRKIVKPMAKEVKVKKEKRIETKSVPSRKKKTVSEPEDEVSRPSSSLSVSTNSTVDNDYQFDCDSSSSSLTSSVVEESSSSNDAISDLKKEIVDLTTRVQFLEKDNETLRATINDLEGKGNKEEEVCYRSLPHTLIEEESTEGEKVYQVELLYAGQAKVAINEKKRTLKTTHPFSVYGDKWIGLTKEPYSTPVATKHNALAFMDTGGGPHFGKTCVDPLTTLRQNVNQLMKGSAKRKTVKRLKKKGQVIACGGGRGSPPPGNSKKKSSSDGRPKKKKPKMVKKHEGCGSLRWRCLTLGHDIDISSVKLVAPTTTFIGSEVINRLLRFYSKGKEGSSVMFYNYPRMISEDAVAMLILLSKLQGYPVSIPLSSPTVLPRAKLTKKFFIRETIKDEARVAHLRKSITTYVKEKKDVKVITSKMIRDNKIPVEEDPLVDKPYDDEITKKMKDLGRRFRETRLFFGFGIKRSKEIVNVPCRALEKLTITASFFKQISSQIEDWLEKTKNREDFPENCYRLNGGGVGKRRGPTYACDTCAFTATKKTLLERHNNKIHGQKTYCCHKCGHKFTHDSQLKSHTPKCSSV